MTNTKLLYQSELAKKKIVINAVQGIAIYTQQLIINIFQPMFIGLSDKEIDFPLNKVLYSSIVKKGTGKTLPFKLNPLDSTWIQSRFNMTYKYRMSQMERV